MTLPPLPPSQHKRRVSQPNGAICLVSAYSEDEMHAYGEACAATERERIKAALLEMQNKADGRHNYYSCAVVQLFPAAIHAE